MQPSSDGSSTVRLSTDDLPSKNRDEIIREFYGRLLLRMDIAPLADTPIRIEASARLLPGATIMQVLSSPVARERTPAMLVDGVDDVLLSKSSVGYSVSLRSGETVDVALGDVVVTAFNHQARYVTPRPATLRTVRVPRASLAGLTRHIDDKPIRGVSSRTPEMQLLFDYARAVGRTNALSAAGGPTVAQHLIDLVALALGASRDVVEVINGRGVRAARLAAVKAEIAAKLTSPSLSAETVAAQLNVSARYIRKLFEGEGRSFSDYVTAERLANVHRRLTDPYQTAKIATLAFDAGFNEVATFNRLFKRHYGLTPSDVRGKARA